MKFTFTAKVWRWPAGPWHFVYVDKKISEKIKKNGGKRIGFGFVPVRCTLGKTTWETTLFPHKEEPYLLCIKKSVREKEGIFEGDSVKINCELT